MGRKQLQSVPFPGVAPLGLAREGWKSPPGAGVSPEEEMVGWGILEMLGGGGDALSVWGKGWETVKLVSERWGRLSAALQSCQCGPWPPGLAVDMAPPTCLPPALPALADCRNAHDIALAHLRCPEVALARALTCSPRGVQVPYELCNLKG
ncbi:unnamed protein product [Pipistrellus nathusii]|uniref:Uncharacterized protein n=1 Tax=Pipistrellus nathusii TaxID=59473 RepID=A0ABP0AEI6_PIPNA